MSAISNILLSSPKLSIIDFIQYPTPPNKLSRLSATPTLFSEAQSAITDERNAIVLQKLPRPCSDDIAKCRKRLLDGEVDAGTKHFQSIDYPISEQKTLKVPIWAFDYWEALEKICEEKAVWLAAEKKLKKEGAHDILDLLSTVPWNYSLPRALGSVIQLAEFCTDDWLQTIHMDQMAIVVNDQMPSTEQIVLTWPHTVMMIKTHRFSRETYIEKPTILHRNGVEIEGENPTYKKIGLYFLVNCGGDLPESDTTGNHWVGMVVDIVKKKLIQRSTHLQTN